MSSPESWIEEVFEREDLAEFERISDQLSGESDEWCDFLVKAAYEYMLRHKDEPMAQEANVMMVDHIHKDLGV